MANSELEDKKYIIPEKILNKIRVVLINNPNNNGIRRAKNILKNGYITYQNMKRLKNFYDNYGGDDNIRYELSGGDLMRDYVNRMLDNDRTAIDNSKKTKQDMTVNHNSDLKPYKAKTEFKNNYL